MLLKSLAVATGLAFTATQAFVIVPDISEADNEIITTLPFVGVEISQVQSQTLKVDCPGCPIQVKHHKGGFQIKNNIPSHLELTFSVDTDSDVDRLLVNDFELYPKAGSWYSILRAPQVLDFTEMATKHPRKGNPTTPQLGYSLAIRPVMKEEQDQQMELIDIDLQIIEVGNSFIDGIPNVNVKLIKTPAGKLMIGSIQATESTTKLDAPTEGQEECTTMYCQWRAAVIEQMKKMHGAKKCGGGMRQGPAHGKMREGHRIKHHHTWGQLFRKLTSHILLPVLIGIVAGVSVSIIGMMVGTFVVCLWRVLVRRQSPFSRRHCRRRGHSCNKAAQAEAAVAEEKAMLIAYEDAPPTYKDNEEETEDKPVQI